VCERELFLPKKFQTPRKAIRKLLEEKRGRTNESVSENLSKGSPLKTIKWKFFQTFFYPEKKRRREEKKNNRILSLEYIDYILFWNIFGENM